ncbi:MAG: ATP-binding protein [Pirellulales bacterium]
MQDYEQAFQGQDAIDPVVQATRRKTLAEAIDQRARVIRQINQRLIDDAAQHRQRTTAVVFWLRVAILMVGPAGGMLLGWNMARRLRSSVKRIQVTLRHEHPDEPLELGTIAVAADEDLDEIGAQVAALVQRLEATTRDLQEARAEVVRAERLAAIGELAAGVAHEFRNPLTSVKLLLQHAAQRDSSSLTTPKLRLILDEIERMEETIQGLLDFSRPAIPRRVRHDLREPLRRAANLVEGRATRQGVRVVLDLGSGARLCDGDARQLQQVFSNLLINGIEAMPGGGTLAVRLTDDPDRPCWRIEFTDEGAGIPPDVLPRLFEPFVSLKERGTGLGLAVSRRIVEAHGGELTASNRADGGAAVNVCLPLVPTLPSDLSDRLPDDESRAPRASTLCGPR